MNKKSFLLFSTFCLLSLLFLSSCKEEEEESKNYMSGTLNFDLPSYTLRNTLYTVAASGITSPSKDSLIYTYKGTFFTPDSLTAQTIQVTTPDSVGTFALVLVVSTPEEYNYSNSALTKYTVVVNPTFEGMVTGFVPSANKMVDSRDGHEYYYDRFGDLDWFTQNLNWTGTGITYTKDEVMGKMLGSLYTWNQAISGSENAQAVASQGLGMGPQGVCPDGWSVPTAEDWANLGSSIKGESVSFFDAWQGLGEGMCVDAYVNENKMWTYHPKNEKTNTNKWNALPAGYAALSAESFVGWKETTFIWSSSQESASKGYYRFLHYAVDQFGYSSADKTSVYASVRCVRKAQNAGTL